MCDNSPTLTCCCVLLVPVWMAFVSFCIVSSHVLQVLDEHCRPVSPDRVSLSLGGREYRPVEGKGIIVVPFNPSGVSEEKVVLTLCEEVGDAKEVRVGLCVDAFRLFVAAVTVAVAVVANDDDLVASLLAFVAFSVLRISAVSFV